MEGELLPQRQPTTRDYRRAASAILFAAFVTGMIGYRFLRGTPDDPRNLVASWLFFLIAAVNLFVGVTVMAYAHRGGSPGASRRSPEGPPRP